METIASDPSGADAPRGGKSFFFDFQQSLGGWQSPGGAGTPFLSRQPLPGKPGTYYANLNGACTSTYAYMSATFTPPPGSDTYDVIVRFDAQNIAAIDGIAAAFLVSNSPITTFSDPSKDAGPFTDSWARYGGYASVQVNQNNTIYVALGWVGYPIVPGDPIAGFGCISVDIYPQTCFR